MENEKLIKAVKQISDTCRENENCDECPFFIKSLDKTNCLFINNLPEDWQFDKLDKDVLFLLSKEEAEESFDSRQLEWKQAWWSRSVHSDSSYRTQGVYYNGSFYGLNTDCVLGIRPAFCASVLKKQEPFVSIGKFLEKPMEWKLSKDHKFYLLDNHILSVPYNDIDSKCEYHNSNIRGIVKQMEHSFLEDAKEKGLLKED